MSTTRQVLLADPGQAPGLIRRGLACAGLALTVLLAACGGGGDPAPVVIAKPATRAEAARFLTQATFGPTDTDINKVMTVGYAAWIDEQMATTGNTHEAIWKALDQGYQAATTGKTKANSDDVIFSFWKRAIAAPDQLRQRVGFALSQIFVISMLQDCVNNQPRAAAHYLDTLTSQAFGNYRPLLESVARHPSMGCYLSHLRNQAENASTGRVPDENFAREVMQLFSIGLYKLDDQGNYTLGLNDQYIETYTPSDVSGLAKVFTGLSLDCPTFPSDTCFYNGTDNSNKAQPGYDDRYQMPMRGYPRFHSYNAKSFLGVTIAPQVLSNATSSPAPDPEASLKVALDTLAAHHNVAPFIAKQLIQRLVTSNPDGAYVERVVKASRTPDGVNLGAMVKAILLDQAARAPVGTTADFGKVREPILKYSALLRAFGGDTATGTFKIYNTDSNTSSSLNQSPLRAASVFNFFRPGYAPPGSLTGTANKVAPEMQLLNESSLQAYLRFMQSVLTNDGSVDGTRTDVQMSYTLPGPTTDDASTLTDLAKQADVKALVARINSKLMYGTMPSSLQTEIENAVKTISIPALKADGSNKNDVDNATKNRIRAALLLTVASPQFQVQQ
jgi:uncharacterized protein (DUF1800 family)